jgi:hypothetical protein
MVLNSKTMRWMQKLITKRKQKLRPSGKNFSKRKCSRSRMVQLTNNNNTRATAVATAVKATLATTATEKLTATSYLDLDPELHTNQTLHLAKTAIIVRRKITSRANIRRENRTTHQW